ncbi:MAG: flavodoxin [Bacillota bacterium]|nr:flavodoxin [Bacillota bacterium]
MKKLFKLTLAVLMVISLATCVWNQANAAGKASNGSAKKAKILVAYFSYQGHTRQVAKWIHEQVGGDIFEIQTVKPYSSNYDTTVDQAKREQQENARPKLKTHVNNMNDYNVVFLGYPNWWNTIPMPLFTFMEEYNFSGKTIIPFCTNGGGGFGSGVDDMKSTLSKAKFLKGIEIRDSHVKNAKDEVTRWVKGLNII